MTHLCAFHSGLRLLMQRRNALSKFIPFSFTHRRPILPIDVLQQFGHLFVKARRFPPPAHGGFDFNWIPSF